GFEVTLVEQKPKARTPAQTSDQFCELVCSNSMRGAALINAVGLLKEELRRSGSLILACADETRVPAGGALAVDRDRFSERITRALTNNPRITIEHRVVESIPNLDHPVILATGPLTGDALAADLARTVGQAHLAYYDAIAPILDADSIDMSIAYRKSRYDKGGDDAYVNCPLDEAQYRAFVAAILSAQKVEPRAFEETRYFEGCLPIEVMASRGEMTLAFGPMKPVGLEDPRTGKRPFAVVQLRQEDEAGSAFNMVGFQTRMTWPEQKRVFCMIPGLEKAEFLRLGSVHRNTFVNAPECLDDAMQLRARPGVYLAGQVTGVEGYVESCAGGLLCALLLAGAPAPPETTALGGMLGHLRKKVNDYQPSNITWAHVAPLEVRKKKRDRYEAMSERALRDFDGWFAKLKPLLV
ncbi:MAG TPA: methylenetetrahydrofolate--tRNA-(uracil(54)-C(5))-methyltransferase (FADH(2)-oxidizing) TrmFO, partial [Polyangiaceae bacterium]